MSEMPAFDYKRYIHLFKSKKHIFFAVSLTITTLFAVSSFLLPKIYMAESSVYIEKKLISELLKGIALTPSADESKGLNYLFISKAFLLKVVNDLRPGKSQAEKAKLIESIQRNTQVRVKDKNIFFVSYKDEDPVLARDLVNTLVSRYIQENVSLKKEDTREANNFLSEQIASVQKKLEEAEREVNEYKGAKGGMISIDEGRIYQEINSAQQKLYDLQLRRRHLEGLRPVTKKAAEPMQNRLLALERKLEELRIRFTDNHPEVLQVKTDIETVMEEMKSKPAGREVVADYQEVEKAEAEIAAIKVTEGSLNRYISSNQALLRQIPAARGELQKLEMERNSRKTVYDQLVARHGQSEVTRQMEAQDQVPTFKVMEPAVLPTQPVSPNRARIILMGIAVGLAGGAATLLLLDQLDGSVKTVETLKLVGVPVLGVIHKMQDPVQIQVNRKKDMWMYAVSATYFSVIIIVLALEIVKPSFIDSVILSRL